MSPSDSPAVRLYVVPDLDESELEAEAARATSGQLSRALDAGTTYESLTAALRSEYGGQSERAEADVDAFLATLRERGLRAS